SLKPYLSESRIRCKQRKTLSLRALRPEAASPPYAGLGTNSGNIILETGKRSAYSVDSLAFIGNTVLWVDRDRGLSVSARRSTEVESQTASVRKGDHGEGHQERACVQEAPE